MVVLGVLWILAYYLITLSRGNTTYNQTKCFETVTYHYSNPRVTGHSVLHYTYKNDHFRTATFNLSCLHEHENNTAIHIEKVQWILPSTMDEYCIESFETDFGHCSSSCQCDCCEVPENVCTIKQTGNHLHCNHRQECQLTLESQFLESCPGREYGCDNQKCHSRWAQVFYSCHKVDQSK